MLSVISYRPFENWSKNWNNYCKKKKIRDALCSLEMGLPSHTSP